MRNLSAKLKVIMTTKFQFLRRMTSGNAHSSIDRVEKPEISADDALFLCKSLYGLSVTSVREKDSYDDRTFCIQTEDHWANTFITKLWPHGYTFKVLNTCESLKKHYEAEYAMQKILIEKGFLCPDAVPNIYGENSSLEKMYLSPPTTAENDCQNNKRNKEQCRLHLCRLFTFIPGKILEDVPYTPSLLYQLGQYVARMHDAWKDFHHPSLESYSSPWCLTHLHELKPHLDVVKNTKHREIVESVMETFLNEVLSNCEYFQKGVIHGDINNNNVLVQEKPGQKDVPPEQRDHDIHGIIDFGDAQDTFYIFEIGVAMMYTSLYSTVVDPILVGGHIMAGYLSTRELNNNEIDALRTVMAARYVQSLVTGLYCHTKDPNNTYSLNTAKKGWTQLENLWTTPKETLYAKWANILDSYKRS